MEISAALLPRPLPLLLITRHREMGEESQRRETYNWQVSLDSQVWLVKEEIWQPFGLAI